MSREDVVSTFLLPREIGSSRRLQAHRPSPKQKRKLEPIIMNNLPNCMKQREIDHVKKYDKIFACHWYDAEHICVGTKDNKLVLWNIESNKEVVIPLPAGSNTPLVDHCGIHFITANADNTLLATGTQNPADIAIFSTPSFNTTLILEGHQDWVFSAQFVEDERLVTASRDCTVKVWSTAPHGKPGVSSRKPLLSRSEHTKKVRDLQYNKFTKKFATLSADSSVKIWDADNLDVISTMELVHNQELVCLAIGEEFGMIAVGSQQHVSFFDPRMSQARIKDVRSNDGDWGVRSVSFRSHVATVGGGKGRISFYDIRKGAFMDMPSGKPYLCTGHGHLVRDATYLTHFEGTHVPHAVYTHAWDPTGSRLFVAGGPLMLGLKGCYAATYV